MKYQEVDRYTLAIATFILLTTLSCGGHEFWATPIASISVTPPSPSLLTGVQQQFTAFATFENGSGKVLSNATWTTSNATIIFINNSGVATAVAQGSATISASSEGVSGSTTVAVTTSPLTSIEITPTNVSISASQASQQFAATGTFSDGSVHDISSGVTWTSSNTAAATINKTGLASLVRAGTTTITAASGNIQASTTLTVLP